MATAVNITLNLQALVTRLVAQLCPGEYKWVFIPSEVPMADFSGPAEEFLYLIIPYIIHFVSQVKNVTKTSPMKPRSSMWIQPLLLSGTVRPETEALANRTGFAFPCHFKKYLFFRECLAQSEKPSQNFLRAFKPREFPLKTVRGNGQGSGLCFLFHLVIEWRGKTKISSKQQWPLILEIRSQALRTAVLERM